MQRQHTTRGGENRTDRPMQAQQRSSVLATLQTASCSDLQRPAPRPSLNMQRHTVQPHTQDVMARHSGDGSSARQAAASQANESSNTNGNTTVAAACRQRNSFATTVMTHSGGMAGQKFCYHSITVAQGTLDAYKANDSKVPASGKMYRLRVFRE